MKEFYPEIFKSLEEKERVEKLLDLDRMFI